MSFEEVDFRKFDEFIKKNDYDNDDHITILMKEPYDQIKIKNKGSGWLYQTDPPKNNIQTRNNTLDDGSGDIVITPNRYGCSSCGCEMSVIETISTHLCQYCGEVQKDESINHLSLTEKQKINLKAMINKLQHIFDEYEH